MYIRQQIRKIVSFEAFMYALRNFITIFLGMVLLAMALDGGIPWAYVILVSTTFGVSCYLIGLTPPRTDGTLKIDSSDPEKDKWMFELNSLDIVKSRKYIRLKIDRNADLSQNKPTL